MKITIHNTTSIIQVNGVLGRVWEGKTEDGQDVICLITRIAVQVDQDNTQFEKELLETDPVKPAFPNVFPDTIVL
jgi:hypothetical protein